MTPRSKIFISYRRDDSSGHVGRLHDALAKHLGADTVFMDIDSIAPGADFVDVLNFSLQQSAVVIVVMGTRWSGPRPDGTRRIDDPNDFVRLEVAKALADPGVRVIPVLINRAEMLSEADLPDGLKPLARRNALEVSDIRWAHDTKLLAEEIAKTPGNSRVLPSFSGVPRSVKFVGAAVGALLLLIVWKPWQGSGAMGGSSSDGMNNSSAELARIPKASEMKLPKHAVSDAARVLKKVRKEWKADAFIDEIYTDCRTGQCETRVFIVSPENMLGLEASRANPDAEWHYVNSPGAVTWGSDPMPLDVSEFDAAIAKAREYGMIGPINTAVLTFRYPRGQPLLMWIITPKLIRTGGQSGFCFDAHSMLQYDCNQLRS